ncbi:MAG: hypothetical protein M3466_19985 [Gemmatimonadota bacterium]|nr:hypothetical protein [Gemmatimonadota bacterium]
MPLLRHAHHSRAIEGMEYPDALVSHELVLWMRVDRVLATWRDNSNAGHAAAQ